MASFPIHVKKTFYKDGHEGIVFLPQPGKHSATVILMHGLGDSADGLEDIVTLWGDEFPHVKFILPTAKEMQITIYMGQRATAWYDIVHLADAVEEKDRDPSKGLDESKAFIQSLIEDEIHSGVLLSRILLMGFSQGGAMTLTTGLQLTLSEEVLTRATRENRYPPHLAGLLVMSGYLPKKYAFSLDSRSAEVPVLHVHGAADPLVSLTYAEKTKHFLEQQGVRTYELKTFTGVGHTLSMDMIEASKTFLHQRLPQHKAEEPDVVVLPRHPRELSMKEIKELVKEFRLQGKTIGLTEKSEYVSLLTDFYEQHFHVTLL